MTTSFERGAADSTTIRARSCALLRRILLAACAAIILSVGFAWFDRRALLRSATELWLVSDQPGAADVAVVLGGGIDYRPFAAADYYQHGLVPKILVSDVGLSPSEQLGVYKPTVQAIREVLDKLGVPSSAIEIFGHQLTNTYTEAKALHAWALRSGAHRIMVPTDVFSARRVRWTLQHVFGSDATIMVPAVEPIDYHSDDWWRSAEGIVGFQNEVIKYVYYRIRY